MDGKPKRKGRQPNGAERSASEGKQNRQARVIREVQAFFADAAPTEVLLSEELSRERRQEAANEAS
jgi:hypothetical protein